MAGQIAVTPEELRSQATHYTRGADSVDNVLSDLKSTQEQIRAEWKGNAFEKYDMKFQELSGKVTQFSQLLREINSRAFLCPIRSWTHRFLSTKSIS